MSIVADCEKRIPKHGDENVAPSWLATLTGLSAVKKESPNMGTKTANPVHFESPPGNGVKKESPNMGTKTRIP